MTQVSAVDVLVAQWVGGPDPLRLDADVGPEPPGSCAVATGNASIVPARIIETCGLPARGRTVVAKLLAFPVVAGEDRLATVVDRGKQGGAV